MLRMNRDVDRERVTAGDRCSRLFAPPLLNHHAAIHFVRLHASSCLHAGVCSPFRSSLDDEWLPLQGGLHTHTQTQTHTQTHTQIQTHPNTHIDTHTDIHTYTQTHAHADTHTHTVTQNTHKHTNTHANTHTHTRTHKHTQHT